MFGLFKKRTPEPSPELRKVQLAGLHIVQAAELAVHAFQHEPHLQWEGAQRWVFYCATIPAFALVIKFEMFGEMSLAPTPAQDAFFKAIEDKLYEVYRQDHNDKYGTVPECLSLTSERNVIRKTLGVDDETAVAFDLLLGILLPNRLQRYQRDWGCGFASPGVHGLPEYAAMRFAADMAGIATPPSLEGYTAADLGIEKYGSALIFLTEFAASYVKARNEFQRA
jgi:hypothetical protein